MNKIINRIKAFTLVELMVVMAIIAFLSVGAYAGLTFALRQGRDTQRRRIVDQIQTALIAYYSDFSEYPGCPSGASNWAAGEDLTFQYNGQSIPHIDVSADYKKCDIAFENNNSLIVNDPPFGLSDYFEGEFKWGPISDTNTGAELLYYYEKKADKTGRNYTVCVALENPRDNCYCVGADQTGIACSNLDSIVD